MLTDKMLQAFFDSPLFQGGYKKQLEKFGEDIDRLFPDDLRAKITFSNENKKVPEAILASGTNNVRGTTLIYAHLLSARNLMSFCNGNVPSCSSQAAQKRHSKAQSGASTVLPLYRLRIFD